MTVTYSDKSFWRLLFRWKGSVWKDIGRDYCIFIILYFFINLLYRFGLDEAQMLTFEKVVKYFHQWNNLIPIQFLIGFYVSNVFGRWWDQLNYVAWPDKFLIFVCGNIQGMDETSKTIRRTFARYTNLLSVMVWKEISLKVKKRFPSDEHLLRSGLINEKELEIYKNTSAPYGKWFVPVSWMVNLLARCKEDGKITDYAYQKMLEELYTFRGNSAMLTVYDWINIPLVYTQVVTLATYGYFLFCLISRQSIRPEKGEVDIYFPLFTTLEFIFYIGWMKVGEDLRCPFGEDDEDFDMNYVLDRNIHVSHMLVDELHVQRPVPEPPPKPDIKDKGYKKKNMRKSLLEMDLFDSEFPKLPHTRASWAVRDSVPNWRLYKYSIRPQDMEPWEEAVRELEEGVRKRQTKAALAKIDETVERSASMESMKLNNINT